MAASRLVGRITGATATRVTAVPEAAGAAGGLVAPEADGTFALALAPGTYGLELLLDGKVVRATPAVRVDAGGDTRVSITVVDGVARVAQEAASASPPATP